MQMLRLWKTSLKYFAYPPHKLNDYRICVWVCVCVFVWKYVFIHIYVYKYTFIHAYVCVNPLYICVCAGMYVRIRVCKVDK